MSSHGAAKTGIWSWITTVDHKRIGIMYGVAALLFLVVGGVEALFMRTQLLVPNNDFITAKTFYPLSFFVILLLAHFFSTIFPV